MGTIISLLSSILISKPPFNLPKNSDQITIYYSDWCGYSRKAIQIAQNNNLEYVLYDIDECGGMSIVLNYFKNNKLIPYSYKTRPLVFNNGKFIGGCTELEKLIHNL
jgi:glutaredoxin